MEENTKKSNKNTKLVVTLLVIVFILIGSGIGYMIYDNSNKKEDNNANTESNKINNNGKPYNTIEEYVDFWKKNDDIVDVEVIDSISDININKAIIKITNSDEMKNYSEFLASECIYYGLCELTDDNILRFILNNIYFSNEDAIKHERDCYKKEVIEKIGNQLYNKQKLNVNESVSGYYCNAPGGGFSVDELVNESNYEKNDEYIYTYEYVGFKLDIVFKNMNGLYKIVRFEKNNITNSNS